MMNHQNGELRPCYSLSKIETLYIATKFNDEARARLVIRWACGQWQLTPKYQHRGLTENRSFIYHGRNGQRKREMRLVWTEEGRDFIKNLIG